MNNEKVPSLKQRLSNWCFTHIPFLFAGTGAYRRWREYQQAPVNKDERPLVLVCDVQTPRPDRDSGSIDADNYMRMLRELGFQVVFFPFDMRHDGPYTYRLEEMGIQPLFYPMIDSLERHLEVHGPKYDLALLNRAQEDPALAYTVKRLCPNARIVFNTVDLHFLRLQRQAEMEDSVQLLEKSREYREIEFDIMRISDATIVISSVEKDLLSEEAPDLDVFHIPYVRETQAQGCDFYERRDLVFVGGFAHPPNVDAIHYFVNEVWHEVRAALPGVRLIVIGSNMPESVTDLGHAPDIDTLGFVEHLTPVLNRCRLSIAPLRYGAGIKGKVGTSLAHGLPCVATPIAAEGMPLIHRKNIMIARDAGEFSESVVAAYTDKDLWQDLSLNGTRLFKEHYSFSSGLKRVDSLLAAISSETHDDS